MAYTRNHARPLLTDAEYDLFVSSLSERIGDLDESGLRKQIGRIRRLRDKARDLHQRQAGAVRNVAGARGAARTANERTAKKATALTEALERFEARLAGLEAAAERAEQAEHDAGSGRPDAEGARGKGPGPNRAARRANAKAQARTGSEGAFMSGSAQAEARTAVRGPQARITAARAAAGRRNQSKRDGR
jgi:hypothetical protein